mmetsp:Transcript_36789/g.86348  ORF Transcript_36789/g.86348 Transcript_36789/m.86348 type:complete len:383 (-) Transcript_36789:881-2029(-)
MEEWAAGHAAVCRLQCDASCLVLHALAEGLAGAPATPVTRFAVHRTVLRVAFLLLLCVPGAVLPKALNLHGDSPATFLHAAATSCRAVGPRRPIRPFAIHTDVGALLSLSLVVAGLAPKSSILLHLSRPASRSLAERIARSPVRPVFILAVDGAFLDVALAALQDLAVTGHPFTDLLLHVDAGPLFRLELEICLAKPKAAIAVSVIERVAGGIVAAFSLSPCRKELLLLRPQAFGRAPHTQPLLVAEGRRGSSDLQQTRGGEIRPVHVRLCPRPIGAPTAARDAAGVPFRPIRNLAVHAEVGAGLLLLQFLFCTSDAAMSCFGHDAATPRLVPRAIGLAGGPVSPITVGTVHRTGIGAAILLFDSVTSAGLASSDLLLVVSA